MTDFKRGDFVTLNGLLAVIVGLEADGSAPEDHVALWYGTDQPTSGVPEIWTVPAEYCVLVTDTPIVHH